MAAEDSLNLSLILSFGVQTMHDAQIFCFLRTHQESKTLHIWQVEKSRRERDVAFPGSIIFEDRKLALQRHDSVMAVRRRGLVFTCRCSMTSTGTSISMLKAHGSTVSLTKS